MLGNNKNSRILNLKRFRRRLKSKEKLFRKNKLINEKRSQGISILQRHPEYDSRQIAPTDFRFVNNRNGVLSFIGRLEKILNRQKSVFVHLKEVKFIDLEAIVLLLGIMAEFKSVGIAFNGNFPLNIAVKKILNNSGFFEQLYPNTKEYTFGSKKGIYTHGKKIYDMDSSCEELSEAMSCVFGIKRRNQGARRVLLEAMKNTISHASASSNKRHWWLSFRKDEEKKKLTVSMLDYGRGIFSSLGFRDKDDPGYKWLEKNMKLGFTNYKILKKIMSGELKSVSRTRKPQHGNGLPGMKTALDNNFISKLVILSNNVYADIGSEVYTEIDNNFSGTLIQFQIDETCKSFPYE